MLRNFLYAITKMVESEYRILILVVMKECPVAFVQTGKCCHVHANIFLQFSKKKKEKKWDWNSLSALYRKLLFLTLDESFETKSETENLNIKVTIPSEIKLQKMK